MEWVLLFGLVVALAVVISNSRQKTEAKRKYKESLAALKANPANADLRQETLKLGRIYSNLMRDRKGRTIFDEMALMNDINAACASTQQVVPSQIQVATPPSGGDLEERLRKLQGLKDKGLIDETDYAKRKAELMAQI